LLNIFIIHASKASTLPRVNVNPALPTASGNPPPSDTIGKQPQAIPSNTTIPKGSSQTEGTTKYLWRFKQFTRSSPQRAPVKFIFFSMPSVEATFSRYLRSGPSPIIVIERRELVPFNLLSLSNKR